MNRTDLLNAISSARNIENYLEIGVSKGENFLKMKFEKKVAVDPRFRFDWKAAADSDPSAKFYELTSDAFFHESAHEEGPFDLIFIDGLHTSEQTLRDFINATHFLAPKGVIVIDDVVPDSYYASMRDQAEAAMVKKSAGVSGSSWMGDVYKVVLFVETFFQQYKYALPANGGRCLVVWPEARAPTDLVHRRIGDVDAAGYEHTVLKSEFYHRTEIEEILSQIASI